MADESFFALSEADRNILANLIEEHRVRFRPGRAAPLQPDLGNAPEVYIARTPDGGIPALNVEIPSPSVRTGTGTDIYDEPGSADCTIYALRSPLYGTGPDELRSAGFTKRVCNLSSTAVAGNTWVIVVRDKFGRWYVSGAGSSGIATNSCSTLLKVMTGSCVEGTVRKLVFSIVRCCDCAVIATVCQTEPSDCAGYCGASGTGSTGPTNPCPCFGSAPLYQIFTLAGVTDSTCTGCSVLNGGWCLTKFNDCAYSQVRAAANFCGNPTQTTGAILSIFSDGSAFLAIGTATALNLAGYYTPAWSCSGTNTMQLYTAFPYCSNLPLSIAVVSSNSPGACAGLGATGNCSSCGAHATATATLSAAGWTDGVCTICSDLANGGVAIALTLTSTCTWTNVAGPGLVCSGVPVTATYTLYDDAYSGWYFDVYAGANHIASYFLPYASWSCAGVNVMNRVWYSVASCLTTPGTVSVQLT